MGMTIDEARSELISGNPYTNKFAEALVVAIGTMSKYQKIKEQVDIAIDKENFAISGARLIQIREIINKNDKDV